MKKIFTIKAKMWVWPGDMAWHFVSLDKEISKSIRENYPKSAMVKVRSEIISVGGEKITLENENKIGIKVKNNKSTKKEEGINKEAKHIKKDNIWSTSIFRNKRDENYILPIKKQIRKNLNIFPEEILEIRIEVL